MAQQCGKKASNKASENNGDAPVVAPTDSDPIREPITGRFVRYAGFILLCGVGMGILAAVIGLPPYAELLRTEHHNECKALRVKEDKDYGAALDRFGEDVASNPVLTKRLAMKKMGSTSEGEIIVRSDTKGKNFTPVTLAPIKYQDPPPPDSRIMHLAGKLQQPQTRRGMIMLAGLMVITSLLLFAPPSKKQRTTETSDA